MNEFKKISNLKPQRIDKIVSNLGYCSRKEANYWVRKNGLTVDGIPIKDTSLIVYPHRIQMNGKSLPFLSPDLTILLHKPKGYVCSTTRDFSENKIIYDLLPESFYGRIPKLGVAGRLDKWASGLIIMSQVGSFVNKLISPKNKFGFKRVYEVEFEKPFSGLEKEIFESGRLVLRGDETPLLPAKFEVIENNLNDNKFVARITLREGRYHQLRRMIAAIGNVALNIHRTQVGPLKLEKDLEVGLWQPITERQFDSVMNPQRYPDLQPIHEDPEFYKLGVPLVEEGEGDEVSNKINQDVE